MKRYYYAGTMRVAMREGNATPLWLFGDHLGSTSLVANNDGSLNSELRYKAWGEIRFTYGTVPATFRYTGQREESSLGLYYYGARWYDPALSRWIQPDSLIPESTQGVQAWDRFAYVNNSPILFNDPSGHCLLLCTIIIGAAVGAIVGAVGYTAYTVATGTEFNSSHMLLAAGGGAVAGALIGSGVGIVAGVTSGAATTAAITGAGTATVATETLLNVTGGDPSDEISAASQAFGDLSQAAEYGVQQGTQLKDAITGTGLVAHHIIEQRLAPALGQTASQASDWLSTAVTPQEHQVFTNAWRSAIGYNNSNNIINTVTATTNDIWIAAQKIYADYPALLDAAKNTIFIQ